MWVQVWQHVPILPRLLFGETQYQFIYTDIYIRAIWLFQILPFLSF